MATFNKRKNSDGSHSWVAWVRVKPFKPATRGGFSTKKQAIAWAEPSRPCAPPPDTCFIRKLAEDVRMRA